MKKVIILIGLLVVFAITAQAGIIWDFDKAATSPALAPLGPGAAINFQPGAGFIGTAAARLTITPNSARSWGNGIRMSSSTAINLTGTPYMYGWVAADSATSFGVVFKVFNGNAEFIPPPGPYAGPAQVLYGTIKPTFQLVQFNLDNFVKYVYTSVTTPPIALPDSHPDLKKFTRMEWIFPDNSPDTKQNFHIFIDNVGANETVIPMELSGFKINEANYRKNRSK